MEEQELLQKKKAHARILAAMSVVMASSAASAQTPASQAELVTVESYNRAQTDVYFAGVVKNDGFGKFRHGRELAPPVQQASGMAASLHLPFSKAFRDPIATRYIRSRLATSMPGR
jgi:hypothetical protein